ncbi:MAG: hypothetical protein U9P10_09585 [Thermodesulfobacteriota bacterium]|nr:hypothetical protein [Thermodesulfobacteriota bacterium]
MLWLNEILQPRVYLFVISHAMGKHSPDKYRTCHCGQCSQNKKQFRKKQAPAKRARGHPSRLLCRASEEKAQQSRA